jgi:hypothetical protein
MEDSEKLGAARAEVGRLRAQLQAMAGGGGTGGDGSGGEERPLAVRVSAPALPHGGPKNIVPFPLSSSAPAPSGGGSSDPPARSPSPPSVQPSSAAASRVYEEKGTE